MFERRLCRTLAAEQEKLNALLAEHVRLLAERKALMEQVHEAVQQHWKADEAAASTPHPEPLIEEASDGD